MSRTYVHSGGRALRVVIEGARARAQVTESVNVDPMPRSTM